MEGKKTRTATAIRVLKSIIGNIIMGKLVFSISIKAYNYFGDYIAPVLRCVISGVEG